VVVSDVEVHGCGCGSTCVWASDAVEECVQNL